jgi:hypothetical protein
VATAAKGPQCLRFRKSDTHCAAFGTGQTGRCEAVSDFEGLNGELVDRLIDLLNSDELGEGGWYNVGEYAAFHIGGRTLDSVIADTGRPPRPGSVLEEEMRRRKLVSRDEYFQTMRQRLSDLVASGLDEAFLVRGLRDEIRRHLSHMADTGHGDRNRAETRERLERMADDPGRIAAFRAQVAKSDPAYENLSDDDIAERLRKMADSELLMPTSPDAALDRWAALTHWDEQAATLLPDAGFEEWYSRMARRVD